MKYGRELAIPALASPHRTRSDRLARGVLTVGKAFKSDSIVSPECPSDETGRDTARKILGSKVRVSSGPTLGMSLIKLSLSNPFKH